MSGPDAITRDDDIDMAGIISALKRRWWVIVLVTAISGVVLFLTLSAMDDRFVSTTRLLVKDGNNAFTRTTAESNQSLQANRVDQQAIRSEVEVVQSDRIALEVIGELDLINNEEFNDDAEAGFFERLFIGERDSTESERNEALDIFKDRLSAYSIEQSRVIVVEFWAHDPQLAQDVTASIATKYTELKLIENARKQENATVWLDPRIAELEDAVNEKEAAVAEFRASEDLLRVDDENALLATQQLSQISTELSRLKAERSSALARANSIKSALKAGVSVDVVPEVLQSNLIQRLREREVDLEAQVSDLSVTLLPGHPRLKSLNSQLEKLRTQIRSAANDIVTSLEREVAATRDAEADLSKEIVRLKSEAARVDEKLVELRAREREAQTARTLLAEYRSRSLEAKSRIGLAQSNIEVISPANYPVDAFFPKVKPFTLAGTAAAMMLSILLVIASNLVVSSSGREAGSVVVPSKPAKPSRLDIVTRELNQVMGLGSGKSDPVTEATPIEPAVLAGPTGTLPVAEEPTAGEQILAVRYAAAALSKLGNKRIAVLSPGGKSGSKTAWVLARHLAAKGKKVVVIDFTTDALTTGEMLDRANCPGFFNVLSGSVTPDKAIFKDRRSRARIVPGGTMFPGEASPQPQSVSDLVDLFARPFEYCILDCGDVEIDDLNVIADDNTVAIVSTVKAEPEDCLAVVDDLEMDGFEDVLQLRPDKEDLKIGRIPVAA